MKKGLNIEVDEKTNEKSELFINKLNSDMRFKSELSSDSMSFEWVNELEFACPYIDNIIRNPRLALINEEDVVKIEKAKKITVASVKDLSKHTHFIEKIDKKTNEVQPSKILMVHPEETFGTYENRFIYTLIDNMLKFITKKESLLQDFEVKDSKTLEYAGSTTTGGEKINIELKISSNRMPRGNSGQSFENELENIKARVKRIKDYMASWKRSEFIQSLQKNHASFVIPPIKKTNMILKNPNFQIAMKLWGFLQTFEDEDGGASVESIDTAGDNVVKGILDDAFLMDYFVLDSISSSKKAQKEKLADYAMVIINQQIKRAISLLLNSGIDIDDEQLIDMISNGVKKERSKRLVGSDDIKKKFKNMLDEYLERTKDHL